MKLAYTNAIKDYGDVEAVEDESTIPGGENLISFDFSTTFSTGNFYAVTEFYINFSQDESGNYPTVGYFGLTGHNATNCNFRVRAFDPVLSEFHDESYAVGDEPRTIMFDFSSIAQSCRRIIFSVTKDTPGQSVTLTHIAAGQVLTVPNGGYASGFKIPWLGRNKVQRAKINYAVGPTALVNTQDANETTLTIRNMPKSYAETTWLDFLDFAFENAFFVRGLDDEYESSYLGFDIKPSIPTAHSNTKELVNVNLKHSTYVGILS